MARKRREATPEEFKALAHPLRLRILRLCLHDPMTNKELADRLDKDPATVLHHVRTLVRTGFLEPGDVRSGNGGALEKPYLATGKSWTLSTEKYPADKRFAGELAVFDAVRDELVEEGPDALRWHEPARPQAQRGSLAEFRARLESMIEEFADRPDDPDGDRFGFFVVLHRRR